MVIVSRHVTLVPVCVLLGSNFYTVVRVDYAGWRVRPPLPPVTACYSAFWKLPMMFILSLPLMPCLSLLMVSEMCLVMSISVLTYRGVDARTIRMLAYYKLHSIPMSAGCSSRLKSAYYISMSWNELVLLLWCCINRLHRTFPSRWVMTSNALQEVHDRFVFLLFRWSVSYNTSYVGLVLKFSTLGWRH